MDNLQGGIKMDYKALKGLVLKKYFSIGAFANDIGWSRNKSSRIVNGIQNPSVDDIVDLTKSLELDEPTFFNIFFKNLSTMYTKPL